MKPAPFEYHRPSTAAEAAGLLAELGDEAKVLAGGQSLIPMLALRLAVFDHLVDIGRIAELKGIERRNGDLWIGAGTTDAAVGASAEVAASVPLLARATPFIGHFQIRNRGTLGGSIAHADPAAEYPAVALALDATMEVVSPAGPARRSPPRDFFDGLWSTTHRARRAARRRVVPGLERTQRLRRRGVRPAPRRLRHRRRRRRRRARRRRPHRALRHRPDRPRLDARAGDRPPRPSSIGRADRASVEPEEVGRLAVAGLESVPDDLHGSAAYRTRVGAAMVARAWASGEPRRRRDG